MFFCLVFVLPLCVSVSVCVVITCLERADLLALVCGVCQFPVGILGQVWYLIISIYDICSLTYFAKEKSEFLDKILQTGHILSICLSVKIKVKPCGSLINSYQNQLCDVHFAKPSSDY